MHGYTGKILHVNLTDRTLEVETPDEAFYRKYVGGSLMGLYYLWKFAPAGIDAFNPENVLTFAVSAPTGLPVSGQSRCTATCKSPSSGGAADAQAGGFWPAELKFAGFDAVVIRGAADAPVYLSIIEGEPKLHDASHLWGKLTYDVDTILKEEWNDEKIEIAQIGISGEKLSNFAAVINMSNRAWGRTGIGAVMGSKMLKAIVVRGTQKVVAADKEAALALSKQGVPALEPTGMDSFGKYGTPKTVMGQQGSGGLPTDNWNTGVMPTLDDAELISGERLYDELLRGAAEDKQDRKGRDTCYACVVRCKRVVEDEWQGNKLLPEYGGPEYETIATFGSYCRVNDLHAATYANQLCNAYGVDTISCGATIAWAMECFENELLTLEETDGIALKFGDAEAMIAILEKTLKREGFGDILAEGSVKAADRLGKGHEYLVAVKGQELPAHMPRVKRSLSVIYATNPFGADHMSAEHDPSYTPENFKKEDRRNRLLQLGLDKPQPVRELNAEKVEFALTTQYAFSATDTLGLCQFVFGPAWQLFDVQAMADLTAAATGWELSVDDILAIGQRRLNLMRAYNAREGLQRDADTLPKKLFTPLKGGASDGFVIEHEEFEAGLNMYYEQAGWDIVTGVPTRNTLENVGLDWVADGLSM